MKIQLDAREKQILKSDTVKVFAVLTGLATAYAHYYPIVSHFIPPQLAAEIAAVMGVIGFALRFRPQAQVVIDVLDGDKSIEQGFSELIGGVPVTGIATSTTVAAAIIPTTPSLHTDGTPTAPIPYAQLQPAGVSSAG